ncbi:MAG: MAPEG family protein [Oceanospirillaceae bacterium]|nr:MAPEG family protein [Oceanospirillaceae bacterium]
MLYAMFALVVLTFVVMGLMGYVRMRSVSKGQVPARYYKLMQGADLPEVVIKTGRHFNNLFEVPVLFYAASILAIVMHVDNQSMVMLAWAFVICRLVHAIIHMTYNHPLHRLASFTVGCCVVLAMWVQLLLSA